MEISISAEAAGWLFIIGLILLPAIIGLRFIPPWPQPKPPGAEKLIIHADGSRSRIVDPGKQGAYERDNADYYA